MKMNSSKLIVFIFLAAAILVGAAMSFAFFGHKSGAALDLSTLQRLQPGQAKLLKAKPKCSIVHFWASWCPPCRAEWPTIIAAAAKLPPEVALYGVSVDDTVEPALKMLSEVSNQVPDDLKYWDAQKVLPKTLGVEKLPETFILNSDNRVVRRIAGDMDWNHPANLSYLQNCGN